MIESTSKFLTLPGAAMAPEVLLHKLLEHGSRIKAVALVVQWDDFTMDTHWSTLKTSELCMAAALLRIASDEILNGGGT